MCKSSKCWRKRVQIKVFTTCKTFIQIFAQKQLLHCIWKWDGKLPLHPALLLSWFQKVTSSSLYCTNAAPATKRPTRNARLTKNKTRVSLKHAKYCAGDEICTRMMGLGHLDNQMHLLVAKHSPMHCWVPQVQSPGDPREVDPESPK